MSRKLFWKLCLIIATGVVALFYVISLFISRTEEGMSLLALEDRQTLKAWGETAEELYNHGSRTELEQWLTELKLQENTWAAVANYEVNHIAGDALNDRFNQGYNLGRNIEWKVHLYFADNPIMELPFKDQQVSFLIQLPNRMRPGDYWRQTEITFQIILPAILLALLSFVLYRHIMKPLVQLQQVTGHFSKGQFDISAKALMGNRSDEFSELALAFDNMAQRISEQIISQRQLIADLSHELRTPLTRLDIALEGVTHSAISTEVVNRLDIALEGGTQPVINAEAVSRIGRESKHIRKLVEDTLILAWLENEQPLLNEETVELVDLLDVLIEDAKFEFPDRNIVYQLPNSALACQSNHRAAGQAIENVLRNALRYTARGKTVSMSMHKENNHYRIDIVDQGPGVPEEYLTAIFKPFFRVDKSRTADGSSFGLGLALAKRQLAAINAQIQASNEVVDQVTTGLRMTIVLPQ
ncbi:two-component sensor histidine kinase [Shewanella sairae]|uniref:histidine kinase n=1 Tax=Shewanella sairae TaxID=190310 RepID=A0ABQ4P1U3_9GAMM|nr:sensor histidine kinase [Shewanella sairae]MCL1129660.1 sensor histidine kinase [Shewanella sairae]GIU41472.1 two-component sensor histidine kinase [Shewanella sairae]